MVLYVFMVVVLHFYVLVKSSLSILKNAEFHKNTFTDCYN